MNLEQMRAFEIGDELRFRESEHGFIDVKINNAKAQATLSTYAGQVLSYRPKSRKDDLLFVSEKAYFADGKAIKGGIPLCWPWFGADPEDKGRPAHGFVRNRQWAVTASESRADGSTKVVMSLSDTSETRNIWPHAFKLDIEITVGDSLRVALITQNTGDAAFTISQALHTYFRVGDIRKVRVLGLEGSQYLDKVKDSVRKTQAGPVRIDGEVDRIYSGVTGELVIEDASFDRRIRIQSRGSSTAVVWNPWVAVAAAMRDLDNDDYKNMICVETANAGLETIEIPAGGEYRIEAEYTIQSQGNGDIYKT